MRILDVDRVASADVSTLTGHLLPGEIVHLAFRSATGAIIFADTRMILILRENLLEEKVETSSYSYRSVRHFSLTEAGGSGSRGNLRIWLGDEQPLQLRAAAVADLAALQLHLATKLA
jgi:hypothetical protein